MNKKIKTLKQLAKIVQERKAEGKKVALVTGAFDVMYLDQINFLNEVKKTADILVTGVEKDETIQLSKGPDRPINKIDRRLRFLSYLEPVDYTFAMPETYYFNDFQAADAVHEKIITVLKPDYLATNPHTDRYWQEKQKRAKMLGIEFLPLTTELSFD